ncbi:phage portal protein [Clostridium cellulovorans]|uniref:Phage portal protein, HK97 family n=1 Tax=Clostridium cellulovorans (strain ATCC 35296 / DSM 3052 / OCM 3 / 743B) TaxID=573061 RepID=D9SSF3_CLOC7|nr:phage portal protein [Clostridium cellulovorans]ADL50550.1 phage portal protein, HK97 family [Clostridium cellulovorans 743B]
MKIPFLSNRFEARAAPIPDRVKAFLLGEDYSMGNKAGVIVNEETAMRTTAVYACVRVIAETIASLPLPLYKRLLRGKEKATYHPLYTVLHDMPNSEMTSFSFRETMMTHLLLWGNAYAQIIKRGNKISELWPLHPAYVRIDREPVTNKLIYKYNGGAEEIIYSQEQILHISGLSFNGITGLSPISMARETIGLAQATEEFGSRFFSNGARPGGILQHPGIVKDPERLRKSWEEVYKGVQNSHKIAVLEEGMQYKEIGIPPNDAQFLETRKFQLNEICRIFRVPPHLIGDLERATFSNIEHQSIDFVVHTIRPWLVRWEQAIQKALIPEEERAIYFAKFTVDGLLRGDFKTRMDGYAVGRQNGWYSANDVREFEDLNPIPEDMGGDLYLVNGNMMTATSALTKGGGEDNGEQKPNGTQDSGINGA